MQNTKRSIKPFLFVRSAFLLFFQTRIFGTLLKQVYKDKGELPILCTPQIEAEDRAWMEGDLSRLGGWEDSSPTQDELEDLQPVHLERDNLPKAIVRFTRLKLLLRLHLLSSFLKLMRTI